MASQLPRALIPIVAAALLAACGGPPETPGPRQGIELAVGDTVDGVLRDTTPTYDRRGRYHLYHFRGVEGQRYRIDLKSSNFDTYLIVGDRSGGLFNPIRSDDDGGSGFDSRLAFLAPRTGTYLVVAQALGNAEDDVGIYTLSVQDLGEPRPAQATPLTVGEVTHGELTFDDPVLVDEDGANYDLYALQVEPGQRYVVSVRSDAFDTYLQAGPLRNDSIQELAHEDDDGAGGTNSRLVFTAHSAGRLGVRVKPYGSGTGPYTLRLDTVPDPGEVTPEPIELGEPVQDELAIDDHILVEGAHFDLYTFDARAGQRYRISVTSDDFDTYLDVGALRDGELDVTHTDDDGGGGTNSRLVFTPDQDRRYGVRVKPYGSGLGDYTLRVDTIASPGPLTAREIEPGQTLNGVLDAGDHLLDDGAYFDLYSFQGEAGDEVVISLTSDDFDAYLSLGHLAGDGLDVLATDDDGGGGFDSELTFRLPTSGTFHIRAESLGSGETGSYTLRLRRN